MKGVLELAKDGYVSCIYERGGCTIYERRPHSCAEYQCYWLSGALPEMYRPNDAGFILDKTYVAGVGNTVTAYEVYVDAFKDEKVWYKLKKIAKVWDCPVFLCKYGNQAGVAEAMLPRKSRYVNKLKTLMVPLHYV